MQSLYEEVQHLTDRDVAPRTCIYWMAMRTDTQRESRPQQG